MSKIIDFPSQNISRDLLGLRDEILASVRRAQLVITHTRVDMLSDDQKQKRLGLIGEMMELADELTSAKTDEELRRAIGKALAWSMNAGNTP